MVEVIKQGRLSVVPAESEHIDPIARDIRASDFKECLWLGFTPEEALTEAFNDGLALTLMAEGKPIGMMGVVPHDSTTAWVWFLATDSVTDHWRDFLRGTRKVIAYLEKLFPQLINIVPLENTETISWLSWAGFDVTNRIYDINGHDFVYFVRCQEYSRSVHSPSSRPVMH